jgi:hypothetical protein
MVVAGGGLIMMRWGSRLVFAVNIVFFLILASKFGMHGLAKPDGEWKYSDLVVILLTGIAVLLAVATVFIAGMAIWGYAAIRQAAQDKAEEIAKIIATDVAQAVATREAISARNLFAEGSPVGGGPAGVTAADALTKELKTGSAVKGGRGGKPK